MKHLLFTIVCCLYSLYSYAQKDTIRTVSMEEVVIKAEAVHTGKRNKKVRTGLVYYHIDTPVSKKYMAVKNFLSTKFPPLDTVPVKLQSAELKLKPYDSSAMSLNFIIFSTCGGDTMYRIINLDKYEILNRKLVLDLSDENIILCPHEFYMGYCLKPKNPQKKISYRLFSTDKGEGAFITFVENRIVVKEGKGFPYIFPFKLSYKVY
ncbi:MAG: hypothetical protein H3C54_05500 [Taibaiella sp.]|nr:hypothetical protein [Taibaiella sp.]